MSVEVVRVTPVEGAIIDILAEVVAVVARDPAAAEKLRPALDAIESRYHEPGTGGGLVVVQEIRRKAGLPGE